MEPSNRCQAWCKRLAPPPRLAWRPAPGGSQPRRSDHDGAGVGSFVSESLGAHGGSRAAMTRYLSERVSGSEVQLLLRPHRVGGAHLSHGGGHARSDLVEGRPGVRQVHWIDSGPAKAVRGWARSEPDVSGRPGEGIEPNCLVVRPQLRLWLALPRPIGPVADERGQPTGTRPCRPGQRGCQADEHGLAVPGAWLSANEVASTLTGNHLLTAGKLARTTAEARSQMWSHSSPSGTVHRRPLTARPCTSGRRRTAVNAG
jgi:hypothetical protein